MIQFDKYEDKALKIYDDKEARFKVFKAEPMVSKKGYPMLKVTLDVFFEEDKLEIMDWLILQGEFSWKFKRFMYSIGMQQQYEQGAIDERAIVNKTGFCKTMVEENKQNGMESVKVKFYLSPDAAQKPEDVKPNFDFDDAIPF